MLFRRFLLFLLLWSSGTTGANGCISESTLKSETRPDPRAGEHSRRVTFRFRCNWFLSLFLFFLFRGIGTVVVSFFDGLTVQE